jgi:hypothetical protein
MKNRLLDYGFGSDEPETPKAPKTPTKKTRVRRGKGKRLIARILEYDVEKGKEDSLGKKNCIYVDGDGQYWVRGNKVTPQQALRSYLVWEVPTR